MPQFSGHWYSGRAARLVFVEAALVGVALSISGHDARGWRELAALVGAAGCVPAALYLADLYDPQVMRNDRTRGANVLKALGFAALSAAAKLRSAQRRKCFPHHSSSSVPAALRRRSRDRWRRRRSPRDVRRRRSLSRRSCRFPRTRILPSR